MLSFLRRSLVKSSGLTAVCFFPERIDVARIERSGELPKVEMLESYERGSDDVDAIKRLGKKYKLGKAQCSTLLGGGDYQMLQVEVPPDIGDKSLLEALVPKLGDMLDQPVANYTCGALRIPTEQFVPGRAQSAYVVVAGNAAVAPRVVSFHEAGVPLKVIDVPELAQRNLAALSETPDRALAFLAFGKKEGLLTFTCNGELYMSRRIDFGLEQLVTEDMDRRSGLFDRVGLEVQRSLDNFDRQYGFLPLSGLLLGPYVEAVTLQGYLRDYLAVKVDVLELNQVLDISGIPELKHLDRQAQCLQTLGSALRSDGVGG